MKNKAALVKQMKARHNLGPDATDNEYMQVYAALTPDQQEEITAREEKSKDDAGSIKPK